MKYTPILFLGFLFSCGEGGKIVNENYNSREKEQILSLINTKEYILDSETSYLTNYLQYVDIDSVPQLCFINEYNNSIYIYEEDSGDFIEKIAFEKEGSNGVNNLQGFYYVNSDSIYVYSYGTNMLYLADQDAKVKSKIIMYDALESNFEQIIPSPYLQTRSPLKGHRDHLYCTGFVAGETSFETTENRPVITSIDTKLREKEYFVNYPKQYADNNWAGGFAYRMPYFDIDSSSLIVSFSADHYLTELNLTDKTNKYHYAGSSKIDYITSYPQNKALPINEDKAFDWYMSNASYEGIFYDKFRRLYYRIARLASKDHISGQRQNKKPIVIIVLDAGLNYLGEAMLPQNTKYHPSNCYVSMDGFNIQVLNDDENKLTFHQFLFTE